jgi:hypothetical protein
MLSETVITPHNAGYIFPYAQTLLGLHNDKTFDRQANDHMLVDHMLVDHMLVYQMFVEKKRFR